MKVDELVSHLLFKGFLLTLILLFFEFVHMEYHLPCLVLKFLCVVEVIQ